MANLQSAIKAGQALGKLALYFGCLESGHFLHRPGGRTIYRPELDLPDLPWSDALMDTGLLKNGNRPDVCDGKVFWTCGGAGAFWYAFYWWDRSGDGRGNSNSGFYVRGFGWPEAQAAFDYACAEFQEVVSRQRHALLLQNPKPPQAAT
ncbi:hypothetical protein EN829_014955 [Mesorhizobium sp. M00.F.Ca.ET.186.01.1.1]|nr:hypothetical protein EN848_14480 [bacterium M00.F.Ca.ET.205.01.1.1]TGU52982.1 hypothetical protein EN795_14915 [bacterium M00.F.Ca.ET.152.01.1.1]TGV35951.1 hypothetical protein EN829_014955 [Mesorhizobium sp. M00.F.Ca.ET.186.01.1.1]TGZ43534.1 hypothetical protein EN805_10525 [bacterium M00.F.Ca.ET.162.01.1.1]